MEKIKQYDNGLKLVVKQMSGVMSVSTGVYVGAGSADENPENNGISHFIEHMLFKGTKKRNAYQIADFADSIGAQSNAFTAKEMTCYYMRSTSEHSENSFELLSDIFFNSVFDATESRREKKVVIEEIAMVEDTPSDVCIDLLAAAHFGDNPLGYDILGTEKTVGSFTKRNIKEYMCEYYCPDNTVISVAGNISFEDAEKLTAKYFAGNFKTQNCAVQRNLDAVPKKQSLYKFKDIEQAHIALSFPSEKFDSDISAEAALANYVLGGGMSSRLFQKIREEKGLCYSVYSYPSSYRSCGITAVYAAVNVNSSQEALNAIVEVIKDFSKTGMTVEEFNRGKEQLKSSLIFSQESVSSIMQSYGKYATLTGKLLSLEEKLKKVNEIKLERVQDILKNCYDFSKMSTSYVGKEKYMPKI